MNLPQPPPLPVTQTTLQDESHLNLLAVFHYVYCGLCLLGIGFLIVHFVMMTFVVRKADGAPSTSPPALTSTVIEVPAELAKDVDTEIPGTEEISAILEPPVPVTAPVPFPGFAKEMMAILIVFYIVMGVIICAFAIANFMSARFIKNRKNKTFSFVVAALNCIQMPFGTVLGVFTIIVLMRPSVKSGYEANQVI